MYLSKKNEIQLNKFNQKNKYEERVSRLHITSLVSKKKRFGSLIIRILQKLRKTDEHQPQSISDQFPIAALKLPYGLSHQ